MCNDYEQHIRAQLFSDVAKAVAWGMPTFQEDVALPRADDIRIGDHGPVMRTAGNGFELVQMKFGLPPRGRGGPIFNMTSDYQKDGETRLRDFSKWERCVVLASAFFEFTGTRYPKAKQRFTLNAAPFIGIAAVCKDDAFAMLTTTPGPDIEAVHDRQIVILYPDEYGRWLSFGHDALGLLKPLPAWSLSVEKIRDEAPAKRKTAA